MGQELVRVCVFGRHEGGWATVSASAARACVVSHTNGGPGTNGTGMQSVCCARLLASLSICASPCVSVMSYHHGCCMVLSCPIPSVLSHPDLT